jgi:hypothetical protein
MDFSENPYAPPPADVEFAAADLVENEVERARRQYLSHEASVRSIGTLYYIGYMLTGVGPLFLLPIAITGGGLGLLAVGLAYLVMAVVFFFVGRELDKLSTWVRWPVGILSGIGLLGVPIGTVINLWILYLVFCRKGRVVFSPEYREVIRQTPHIRYRTSWPLIVLAVVLVASLASAVASVVIGFLFRA